MKSNLMKLLSLALVLVMVMGLFAGCGQKEETPAESLLRLPLKPPLRLLPRSPQKNPLRLLPIRWSSQTTTCPRSSAPSSLTLPTTRTLLL